jgi:putative protease
MPYVKNITAHYRLLLDEILTRRPEYARAASGRSTIAFTPNVDKTFHRGHTDYFANGRGDQIAAFDSPKFVGLHLGYITKIGAEWIEIEADEPLANGDGLNYMHKREVFGIQVNTATQKGNVWRVFPNEAIKLMPGLQVGLAVNRNRDHRWESALSKKSAERKVALDITLLENASGGLLLNLRDEDGIESQTEAMLSFQAASSPEQAQQGLQQNLSKLGATMFLAQTIQINLPRPWFVAASSINALRREAIERHEAARLAAYQRPLRKAAVEPPVIYPETNLSYLANVYNHKARAFYHKHGVELIAAAYEAHEEAGEVSLMITKHCLRFSFNLCPKQAKGVTGVQGQVKAEPMTLVNGGEKYTLKFDCKPCEMHVMGKAKKSILQSAPPVSEMVGVKPLVFHKTRPAH